MVPETRRFHVRSVRLMRGSDFKPVLAITRAWQRMLPRESRSTASASTSPRGPRPSPGPCRARAGGAPARAFGRRRARAGRHHLWSRPPPRLLTRLGRTEVAAGAASRASGSTAPRRCTRRRLRRLGWLRAPSPIAEPTIQVDGGSIHARVVLSRFWRGRAPAGRRPALDFWKPCLRGSYTGIAGVSGAGVGCCSSEGGA